MLYFFITLFVVILVIFFFYLLLQGAIYVPSNKSAVNNILKLSDFKKGDKVADLGSGDGRIVLAFAQRGAIATGFEINPFLVWLSRKNIDKHHLQKRASIKCKSYWRENLSEYDILIVFGTDYMMKRLERKLLNELKPGSTVLVNLFPFPDWKPEKTEKGIYVYKKL